MANCETNDSLSAPSSDEDPNSSENSSTSHGSSPRTSLSTRSRKRRRRSQAWKKNVRKKRRNAGERYTSDSTDKMVRVGLLKVWITFQNAYDRMLFSLTILHRSPLREALKFHVAVQGIAFREYQKLPGRNCLVDFGKLQTLTYKMPTYVDV